MFRNSRKVVLFRIFVLTSLSGNIPTITWAQQPAQRFTVSDEIGLAHFGDPYALQAEAVRFSPDGNYFVVDTERGRLDLNRVEDSLRFYRSRDVENFVEHSDESLPPSPIWVMNRSTDKEGPIIRKWRWLADSTGVAFLERTASGKHRLMLADFRKKSVESLTPATDDVDRFDVRDRNHYVFTSAHWAERRKKIEAERQAPALVATGRRLDELIFPDNRFTSSPKFLWAVIGGKRLEVKRDDAPLALDGDMALSPEGGSIIVKLRVPEIPLSWEALYRPPYASDPYRIHSGSSVHQYVQINLQTGSVKSLTQAPVSIDVGSWAYAVERPSWSSDGQEVLLPGTFIKSQDGTSSGPCVAVVDLPSNKCTCVEILKGGTETGHEKGYHDIFRTEFVSGDKHRVMVSFYDLENSIKAIEYHLTADGTWRIVRETNGDSQIGPHALEVAVKQGLNDPPQLVATSKQASRVIWDPNPQLKTFELGQAEVYTWKDKEGGVWKGGLYRPINYKSGRRYPLVIQTHDFTESEFRPSGVFPTAFAARALAAAEIMVLQVGEHCHGPTPLTGPCVVSGYETAERKLVSEGLVDPEKIGIVGFSNSGFYVMEALTFGSLHVKAASITDSTLVDYSQYILYADHFARESDAMIGAPPFGEGLQQWLKRSPGFNLDKVTAPLLVVGEGPRSLLVMWEPYAGLRYLHKPVDLVMLNTDEHILTNPAVRLASQGGSVDWFRFWLQDYEDPDPAKAEQYARWRELRKLQEVNESKLTMP